MGIDGIGKAGQGSPQPSAQGCLAECLVNTLLDYQHYNLYIYQSLPAFLSHNPSFLLSRSLSLSSIPHNQLALSAPAMSNQLYSVFVGSFFFILLTPIFPTSQFYLTRPPYDVNQSIIQAYESTTYVSQNLPLVLSLIYSYIFIIISVRRQEVYETVDTIKLKYQHNFPFLASHVQVKYYILIHISLLLTRPR